MPTTEERLDKLEQVFRLGGIGAPGGQSLVDRVDRLTAQVSKLTSDQAIGNVLKGPLRIGTTNIEQNSITAAKIAVGTITATEISAGSITTEKLAAQAVTAAKITTGTITATQIAAGTITGTLIAAGTITSDKITVANLSALSADMGTITAGTITGGTVQTAASGSRVVLNSSGVSGYAGVTQRFFLSSDGSGWLGNSSNFSWTLGGVLSVNGAILTNATVAGTKLEDLAVTTGKLAALAVTDAKINDLSVGKLTAGNLTVVTTLSGSGAIQNAGVGSNRIVITASEIAGYNSSNAVQFRIRSSDGKGEFGGGGALIDATGIHFADSALGIGVQWDTRAITAGILGLSADAGGNARLYLAAEGATAAKLLSIDLDPANDKIAFVRGTTQLVDLLSTGFSWNASTYDTTMLGVSHSSAAYWQLTTQGSVANGYMALTGTATASGKGYLFLENMLYFAPVTADPANIANGMLWYRSDTNQIRVRLNSTVYSINVTAV